MTNLSARTWVLMGFGISLISVLINVFILSGINDRIKEADGELSGLTSSLSSQATELNRAEIKYDFSTVLNHVSKLATGEQKKEADADSVYLLQSYLKRNYAAVNNIPATRMLKAENEELTDSYAYIVKVKEAEKKSAAGDQAAAERLLAEAEAIEKRPDKPKSELGRKLDEAASHADPVALAGKSTLDILYELSPYIKSSNEQFITNYQTKEARISELRERKAKLSWWASIATYLAVSLQLFGLMFVLTKDLVNVKKETKKQEPEEAGKEST